MFSNRKNKILLWLVIFLVIANAITLVFLLRNRPFPKESPASFLSRELSFTEDQKKQYEGMVSVHRDSTQILRKELQQAKDEMFALLKQSVISDSIKQSAVKKISTITERMELFTLAHFQEVRSICSPAQKDKFDQVISKMLQLMSTSRRPPPGVENLGPPPHDEMHQDPPPTH